MKPIDKNSIYSKLKDIKENNPEVGTKVSECLKKVVSSQSVPFDVILFVNKYSPIDQFYTYNKIYENRHKNPLYKNLVNENLPVEEKAIAVSSFITQVMIRCKEEKDDISDYCDMMNIDFVLEALRDYSHGDNTKLDEVFYMIRDVLKAVN